MMPSELSVKSGVTLAANNTDIHSVTKTSQRQQQQNLQPQAQPQPQQCSLPYPGLQVAVEHLLELAEVMTSEEYGFKDDDILRIDEVIETLEALEATKSRLHEELETASISAATLRSR